MPAKRLHAHHGADHVPVHVHIARLHARKDVRHRLIDAGMQPKRERVTGRADRRQHCVQPVARIAHDMQDGAEHLGSQQRQTRQLDDGGHDEGAVGALRRKRSLVDDAARVAHGLNVRQNAVTRGRADDGADIGRKPRWVTHRQLGQGTKQHGQHAIRRIVLQAQHPQGRASLPGAIECRDQHVRHHLLRQCRAVGH